MSSSRRRPRPISLLGATALTLALLVATLSVVRADFLPRDWRYWKAIALPSTSGDEEMVELVLDREVFSGAASGLVDLRVIAGEAEEIPYQLRIEAGQRQRTSRSTQIRDLAHLPGQYSTFVADLGQEGLLHNEIEISATNKARNFRRKVALEGSQDGETWLVLRDDAEIFEFTVPEQDFHARDTTLRYPESTVRYLRIRIINDGEEPLNIEGALVSYVEETPPVAIEHPATIIQNRVDSERQASVVLVDLGSGGIPTSSLEVYTPAKNFYREVVLEGSNDQETWRILVSRDAIHAFDTPRYVGADRSIDYPQATFRYLRLSVLNQDNPPLVVSDVRVTGPRHKLLFPVRSGVTYRLYYGNDEATAPAYDLGRYLGYLESEDFPEAELESQQPNPLFEEKLPPFSERFPWLLPAVVIGAGALIALFLARLLWQVRRSVSPPS